MSVINAVQTYKPGGNAYPKNLTFEPLAADPTGAGLWGGRVWFNTTDSQARYYDGAAVRDFPGASSAELVGNYTGSSATYAGLPTVDVDGSVLESGDTAILSADDGANVAGWYVYNAAGPSWDLVRAMPVPGSATVLAEGLIRIATNAETIAGTLATVAVSPAGLQAKFDGRSGSALIGDGSVGPFTFNHLVPGVVANERLHVEVEEVATGCEVDVLWDNSTTSITVTPVAAVTNNEYRVTWSKAGFTA